MVTLSIVGTGPGSPEYVIPLARKTVRAAKIVIGAERSLSLFSEDITGERLTLTAKNIDDALTYAAESAKNGNSVALLSTGDPGFSGLLGSVLRRSVDKSVEVKIIPGISSIQVCAARLSIAWDDAVLLAFHDDVHEGKKRKFADAVKAGKTVLLLPMPKAFPPSEIAVYLLKAGVNKKTRVVICENLTLPNEKILEMPLEVVSEQMFASLIVMVIKGFLDEKPELGSDS